MPRAAKPDPKKKGSAKTKAKKPRKRASAHRWHPLEVGARCVICGVERKPERKQSARIGKVFVLRYFDKEGNDLGRVTPKCLTGDEKQTGLFDPERFE